LPIVSEYPALLDAYRAGRDLHGQQFSFQADS
jgi:hypothetical protein